MAGFVQVNPLINQVLHLELRLRRVSQELVIYSSVVESGTYSSFDKAMVYCRAKVGSVAERTGRPMSNMRPVLLTPASI